MALDIIIILSGKFGLTPTSVDCLVSAIIRVFQRVLLQNTIQKELCTDSWPGILAQLAQVYSCLCSAMSPLEWHIYMYVCDHQYLLTLYPQAHNILHCNLSPKNLWVYFSEHRKYTV